MDAASEVLSLAEQLRKLKSSQQTQMRLEQTIRFVTQRLPDIDRAIVSDLKTKQDNFKTEMENLVACYNKIDENAVGNLATQSSDLSYFGEKAGEIDDAEHKNALYEQFCKKLLEGMEEVEADIKKISE